MSRRIPKRCESWLPTLALLALSSQALGADDAKKAAARAFDEGVKAYERASYEEAARAFLRADALVPSDDALGNALASAQRAGAWIIVVDAATRAIGRDPRAPKLAAKGRQALADASLHLARVELACEPLPCTLEMDGTALERGEHFVLPGTHVMSARGEGKPAEERMSLAAGATYQVILHPTKAGEAARPSEIRTAKTEESTTKNEEKTSKPARREGFDKPPPVERASLPLGVFYAAAGVTVALIGVTTWSGLDALAAKRDLGDRPTKSEVEDVKGKIRRTDWLVAASALGAVATVWVGVALVDFSGGRGRAQVGFSPLSRSIELGGRF